MEPGRPSYKTFSIYSKLIASLPKFSRKVGTGPLPKPTNVPPMVVENPNYVHQEDSHDPEETMDSPRVIPECSEKRTSCSKTKSSNNYTIDNLTDFMSMYDAYRFSLTRAKCLYERHKYSKACHELDRTIACMNAMTACKVEKLDLNRHEFQLLNEIKEEVEEERYRIVEDLSKHTICGNVSRSHKRVEPPSYSDVLITDVLVALRKKCPDSETASNGICKLEAGPDGCPATNELATDPSLHYDVLPSRSPLKCPNPPAIMHKDLKSDDYRFEDQSYVSVYNDRGQPQENIKDTPPALNSTTNSQHYIDSSSSMDQKESSLRVSTLSKLSKSPHSDRRPTNSCGMMSPIPAPRISKMFSTSGSKTSVQPKLNASFDENIYANWSDFGSPSKAEEEACPSTTAKRSKVHMNQSSSVCLQTSPILESSSTINPDITKPSDKVEISTKEDKVAEIVGTPNLYSWNTSPSSEATLLPDNPDTPVNQNPGTSNTFMSLHTPHVCSKSDARINDVPTDTIQAGTSEFYVKLQPDDYLLNLESYKDWNLVLQLKRPRVFFAMAKCVMCPKSRQNISIFKDRGETFRMEIEVDQHGVHTYELTNQTKTLRSVTGYVVIVLEDTILAIKPSSRTARGDLDTLEDILKSRGQYLQEQYANEQDQNFPKTSELSKSMRCLRNQAKLTTRYSLRLVKNMRWFQNSKRSPSTESSSVNKPYSAPKIVKLEVDNWKIIQKAARLIERTVYEGQLQQM